MEDEERRWQSHVDLRRREQGTITRVDWARRCSEGRTGTPTTDSSAGKRGCGTAKPAAEAARETESVECCADADGCRHGRAAPRQPVLPVRPVSQWTWDRTGRATRPTRVRPEPFVRPGLEILSLPCRAVLHRLHADWALRRRVRKRALEAAEPLAL